MSLNVPAYRVTEDDLVDADKKLKRGLGPLLDALNRSLTAAVQALVALALPTPMSVTFSTDNTGVATVTLLPGSPIKECWVTALTPTSGSITTVWSVSTTPKPKGVQLVFRGLAHLTTYALTVRYF